MRHRTKPLVTTGVALIGGFFCCLGGCGSFRGSAAPSATLTPNYLASVAPAAWPLAPVTEGRTTLTYHFTGGNPVSQRLAQDGADLWNGVLRPYHVEVGRVGAGGLIPVSFVSRDFLGAGALGRTEIEVNPSGEIVTARVFLTDEILLPPTRRQALGTHEIGHALGIRGHSDNPLDIMHGTVPVLDIITRRDANTMVSLYRLARDGTPYPPAGRGRRMENGNRLLTFVTRGAARDGPLECAEE